MDKHTVKKNHKLFRIVLRVFLWMIGIPAGLVLLTALMLQSARIQTYVCQKATVLLSGKLHSRVSLQRVDISFPSSVNLAGVYVETPSGDTLLYARKISVEMNLLNLFSKKIELNEVDLERVTARITRNRTDSLFNFAFILAAFEGKNTVPEVNDTTSPGWGFSIKKLNLSAIYFLFDDAPNGMRGNATIGNLAVDLNEFDLDLKKIHVRSVRLKNSDVTWRQDVSHARKDTTSPAPFDYDLGLGLAELSSVNVSYSDNTTGRALEINVGELKAGINTLDLIHERVALKNLSLSDSRVRYKQAVVPVSPTVVKKDPVAKPQGAGWRVTVDELDLLNNSFGYDDNALQRKPDGMDYGHLLVEALDVSARDISVTEKSSGVHVENMSFREQCGFGVKKFRARIHYDTAHAELAGLRLETDHTTISDHLAVSYPSLDSMVRSPEALGININLKSTTIGIQDVLYFLPAGLKDSIHLDPAERLTLSGNWTGSLNDLTTSGFSVKAGSASSVRLVGKIKNIMTPADLLVSLPVISVQGSAEDLRRLLPAGLLPGVPVIPAGFNLEGSFAGYLKNFNATLDLKTTAGSMNAVVKMNPSAGNKEQPYDVSVGAVNLDLGYILKQPERFGAVTMKAVIKGSGLDTSNIHADVSLAVEKAVLNKYEYSNLTLQGTVDKKSFTGTSAMQDKNLAFTFNGTVNLDESHPQGTFTLDLQGSDLKALHLTEEDIRVSARVTSGLHGSPGRNIIGRAAITNALVIRNTKKYPLDSLVLVSEVSEGVTDVQLRSEILMAGMKGDITLKELPTTLARHFNSYFNLNQVLTNEVLRPQKFSFHADLLDPTLFSGNLFPRLEKLTPFALTGAYDSEARTLTLDGTVPQVRYAGVQADSFRVNLASDKEKLDYGIRFAQVSNPTLKFENFGLSGQVRNNIIGFALHTSKDDSAKVLELSGALRSVVNAFELKLNEGLVLNGEPWVIDSTNYITFGKPGTYFNRLMLSSGSRSVSVNTLGPDPKDPMEIKFSDFELGTVSKLVENNKELVRGNITGNIVVEKHNTSPAFKSDLGISNFVFQSVSIGNIKIKADNYVDPSIYELDMSLDGNGNLITLKGNYNALTKRDNLDLLLNIENLGLASVEPFTFGQVTQMSGGLNGKLKITGTTASPHVAGAVNFKEAALKPHIIDSYLKIPDAKVVFESKKMRFSNFVLFDSLNNRAVINGYADAGDLKNINFDLNIKSYDFLALNTTRADNPLYYGTVFLDSDIGLKGTPDAPVIDVKAKINKGSSLTYVRPESQVGKDESKGIVEFTDSLDKRNVMLRSNDTLAIFNNVKGIELNAAIDINRQVSLKMIVDPASGDSLFINGGGLLDFSLDRSGKTNLTGKYRIQDGGYYMAINDFVKRSFKIEKGSTVSWSGDVLDAYVDIKAIYTLKTSPLDLVQNELSGMNELEKNKYRNLLTFNVYLKMTGYISSPEISFDIQLDPKDRGALNGAVNARLAQLAEDETQLNKQVFALLTLKRFVGENPLESSGNGGFTSASRSSASQVLTQQLNAISGKYVNFVDLDLGVNSFEDYSSGQEQGRTQLQVGVSKQLLNEKVTIRVGGNVELEGERAKQNNANDMAGNISIDYKLTDDGRYKLKAFRQNQYENAIEGELTKTGAGIIYVRNFNRFKELLKKPAKRLRPKVDPEPAVKKESVKDEVAN